MGINAVYFALPVERIESLWDLDDSDFRNEVLDIESDESVQRVDIAKIWDALHCTLTGVSASEPIEGDRLSEAIVGVYPRIYDDDDYSVFVSVTELEQLPDLIEALHEIEENQLASRLDPKLLKKQKIYPTGIWKDDPESLCQEMAMAVRALESFYRMAHQAGLYVLATMY